MIRDGGPDADAFAGLGLVAIGRELPDDARALAAEALALDPSHRGARGLMERVAA